MTLSIPITAVRRVKSMPAMARFKFAVRLPSGWQQGVELAHGGIQICGIARRHGLDS